MRVLITGTSTGIGLATAVELGRAGHRVFATMRNPDRAPQLGEIVAQERLPVSILTMDVDSDESVNETVGNLQQQGSAIDVLINNAGIERMGSIEELPMEAFRSVMETNYFGSLRCIRAVVPRMRQNLSGCIIMVTSVAGRIACAPMGPYTASKWALEALSEVLAQELKPFNIRVAIVQPGIIDTGMARRIETPGGPSLYPQRHRVAGLFQASLAGPRPPSVVAQKIREIIESGTWKLRHPAGPDAEPFLGWRASMTDEAWIEWGASEDDVWYARVEQDFGLNARSAQAKTVTADGSETTP
jgi:NAD(P)-dependent dehydrogenase (short-subunit alcohol dehydrogenase family)